MFSTTNSVNKFQFMKFKSLCRLFVFLAFFFAFFASEKLLFASSRLSKNELRSLSIVCQKKTVFTHEEIQFVLDIPHTEISDVQFDMPELPLGVRFISSLKNSFVDSVSHAENSKIQIWLSFSDSGEIRLPPITAKISGKTVYIPFEKINVFENPAMLSPVLSVELNKNRNFEVGSEINFDVYIQYCTQILNFSYKVPKDAILKELSRDEFTKGKIRKNEFSVEKTKIASFMWKPLEPGEIPIPEIVVDAIAYNGDRKNISTFDLMRIPVGKTTYSSEKKSDLNIFASAFFESSDAESESASVPLSISKEELLELAELRCRERHSLPFSNIVEKRKALEKKIGIEDSENESSLPLFLFLSVVSLIFILLHIVMVMKKKLKLAVFNAIMFVLFVVFAIRQNVKISQEYAVSTGGKLYSVPELSEKNQDNRTIPMGVRLKVVEKVGNWLCIECSEMSGWTRTESVIFIK